MKKRKYPFLIFYFLLVLIFPEVQAENKNFQKEEDRAYWVEVMTRLADPVLVNLSNHTLKKNMPYESLSQQRSIYSHLEAVGRLVCGMAPWLELGPDDTPEGKIRNHYIDLTVKGLQNAVDPSSPDYLVFDIPYQPLVDAAFLAQGLLRAPTQIWGKLGKEGQENMIQALKKAGLLKHMKTTGCYLLLW